MRFIHLLFLLFHVLILEGCGHSFVATKASETPSLKEITARHGAVASAHPLASFAGRDMLKQGGNAIDAAVAASFVISVVRPQSSGIGGGGFLLFYNQDEKQVKAFDFRERAPLASTADMFLNRDGREKSFIYNEKMVGKASVDGYLSVGVPGLIAGLLEIHQKFGKLPLKKVMAHAITIAESGFTVYPALRKAIKKKEPVLRHFPESSAIFLPKGQAPPIGDLLIQKNLANTLRLIAHQGKDVFYKGEIADALVSAFKKGNGLITKEDLAAYKVYEVKPLATRYRSYEVVGMPPPSSGGLHIIQILNILSHSQVGSLKHNSPSYLHLLTESMRRAFLDRAHFLGDPRFVDVPIKELCSKDYAKALWDSINIEKATPSTSLAPKLPLLPESPSTTHISVVDQWGNAVSTTQTINNNFGSGATILGIVLNNEMDDFSKKPKMPNAYGLVGDLANSIAPGKTMLSSMSPTLVFDRHKNLRFILGSPGGPHIITATLQTLLNLIDFNMPLADAVNASRIHHQWLPDEIVIENKGISKTIIDDLKKKGHAVTLLDDAMSDVQAIELKEDGSFIAVSDTRSDGQPAGL